MESYEKANVMLNIFKGVGISLIFTIISLIILSSLLVYTNLSENLIKPAIITITGISILIGSSIGNRKSKKNGLINGAFVGIIYILCIYIISSITNGGIFSLNLGSIIMMIVGIISGIIGGIIGVNI